MGDALDTARVSARAEIAQTLEVWVEFSPELNEENARTTIHSAEATGEGIVSAGIKDDDVLPVPSRFHFAQFTTSSRCGKPAA